MPYLRSTSFPSRMSTKQAAQDGDAEGGGPDSKVSNFHDMDTRVQVRIFHAVRIFGKLQAGTAEVAKPGRSTGVFFVAPSG